VSLERDSCAYQSKYCEENVWQLLSSDALPADRSYAVVISNRMRAVRFWNQRAAARPKLPIIWDYHVVALVDEPGEALVYDLDSVLPFPLPLFDYLGDSFRADPNETAVFEPWFRVIPRTTYLEELWSDRSHMRTENGGWQAPPPAWPAPMPKHANLPLLDAIDLSRVDLPGDILSLAGLRRRFPCPKRAKP
jgi:hypothetical protein